MYGLRLDICNIPGLPPNITYISSGRREFSVFTHIIYSDSSIAWRVSIV